MADIANTIASAAGTAAGSAMAAPITGTASIISAIAQIAKPLIDLIPDPQKKLEAQQHVADQQYALALAQIEQQNKIIQATSDNVKNDPHSSAARAYFCYGVTTMILGNYGVLPVVALITHKAITPFEIPSNILWIFATLMLGFVGVPSVMETLKSVMGMPGQSEISLPLGLGKISNKN